MRLLLVRRAGLAVAGLALVAIVGGIVGGAPVVGTGPITLPLVGQTRDIWNGPNTSRVGAKVSISAGRARVQAVASSGAITPLGQVGPGDTIVWEGEYDRLRVEAMEVDTAGSYETRAPIGGADPDRMVGQGTVTTPAGAAIGFYGSQSAVTRLVLVTAGSQTVSLRQSHAGTDVLSIDAGDTGFIAISGTELDAAGGGAATYKIYEIAPSGGPYAGTATGTNGDTDAMKLDGTKSLNITVTNAGPGTINLTTCTQGGPPTSTAVSAGQSGSVSGAVTQCAWTVQDSDPMRTTTVNFSVSGQ